MAAQVLLGHGASGTAASMAPYVAGLEQRGIAARALELPRSGAERAMPVVRAAITDSASTVLGGHSYGGRVASLVAAETAVAGLVLFAYPLHRPGHPEQLRTEHWPRIGCPVLLLSGERDPFATLELLRKAVRRLPEAELVTYPGVGHGLHGKPGFDDALDRAAAFVRRVTARVR
jgi:predicted alpha/beta-hydrolase family hydrolase